MSRKYYLIAIIVLAVLTIIFIVILIMNFLYRPEESTQSDEPRSPRITATPFPTFTQEGEANFSEEANQELLRQRRETINAFQERKNKIPFLTKLPYSNNHFSVEIMATSDTIIITTFGGKLYEPAYREEALRWIRQNGGNPEALTIIYKP